MRKKFKVLQIGPNSYKDEFNYLNNVYWEVLNDNLLSQPDTVLENMAYILKKVKTFDFILIETEVSDGLLTILNQLIAPYNTYVVSHYWDGFKDLQISHDMLIREFKADNHDHLIERIKSIAFVGQYGDKIHPKSIIPNDMFKGDVYHQGNKCIVFEGDFGTDFQPLATWQYNIFYERDKVLEIWPEFKLEGDVDIQLTFRMQHSGSIDEIFEEFTVSLSELDEPIKISRREYEAFLAVSIQAKGTGKIALGALHRRWSRLEFGSFLMGGNRYSDGDRDEFIYYFNPGDLKPPLNVYFSGYRTAEGFEGYFMMNMFHAPFLLIGDPRLEGGSFYMGSEEYENKIKSVILECLDYLGFKETDLILSGLSMGSFGALYYGAQLNPTAVIAGKPLVNIGTIADNMKLLRPRDFGTANDMVYALTGGTDQEHIHELNNKFWDVFSTQELKNTTFGLSYMENDDYDLFAFDDLLPVLTKRKAKTISRAITGRHNDDSSTINNWFIHFFNIILQTKFGRASYDRK